MAEDHVIPQYNGKQERSISDIKSFERAMRRHGKPSTVRQRIDAATTRAERDAARRRAIEQELLTYGLMKVIGDVCLTNSRRPGTK